MEPFVQVKEPFQLAPGVKHLKARDYLDFLSAAELLERAEQSAQATLAAAQARVQKQEAAGFAEGLAQGKQEVATEMATTMLEAAQYFESVEREMVQTVTLAMKQVLGSFDERELVLRVVRHLLRSARDRRRIIFRVSREQFERLREDILTLAQQHNATAMVDVRADAHLGPTDCVMETEIGVIEAGVEQQIAALEEALKKSFAARPARPSLVRSPEEEACPAIAI
ncbi:HrpE/YscL family type III secretion apparatus protein [Acanthopleuribacter pedis]|uniref:Type 3 secretion system stator protein n=1 Tax=Acanthopleuribacter pedis TaxID=442870 RepID=A0A8J7U7G6_9BACT|nr:HrpE/YscL family type III secretion apparatus protein [Acanthopleuribacter pedis]MBO1322979.1 HrpE/YscL family type III secretion apparatus protein [Acanthopleuribacter pedis]